MNLASLLSVQVSSSLTTQDVYSHIYETLLTQFRLMMEVLTTCPSSNSANVADTISSIEAFVASIPTATPEQLTQGRQTMNRLYRTINYDIFYSTMLNIITTETLEYQEEISSALIQSASLIETCAG